MNRLTPEQIAAAEAELWRVDDAAWAETRPRVLPADWQVRQEIGNGGTIYETRDGLRIIASVVREQDDRRWFHVSCSRRASLPSYADLKRMKDVLMPGRTALQVFPPKEKHVNIHPFVLHLWACLDGDVTPDFTRGLGMI